MLLSFSESCFLRVIRFYAPEYNENKKLSTIGTEVKWYFVKIFFFSITAYNNRPKSDILKMYSVAQYKHFYYYS